jgi:SM-20-related protein
MSSTILDIANPNLDLAPYAEEFARFGRVRLPEFLKPDVAEHVYSVFQAAPWSATFLVDNKPKVISRVEMNAMSPQKRFELRNQIFAETLKRYQFSYLFLALEDAVGAAWDKDQVLPALHAYLNSEAYMDLGRRIAGLSGICSVSYIASRYMRESFLAAHNDAAESLEDRLVAYTIGFSKDWKFDWGGLLQFLDAEDGRVVDSYLPTFNTLTLFRVPQLHSVSYVTPFAMGPRLSVTGWYHGDKRKP